jgi:hypothetical protein
MGVGSEALSEVVVDPVLGPLLALGCLALSHELMRLDGSLDPKEAMGLAIAAGLAAGSFGTGAGIKAAVAIHARVGSGKLLWHKKHGWDVSEGGDSLEDLLKDSLVHYKKQYPESVEKVGGRYPINGHWAGKVVKPDDLSEKVRKNIDDFEAFKKKYPDGVFYNDGGYPDFGPHVQARVKVKLDLENPQNDMKAATKAMGWEDIPDDMTWHHHQDVQDGYGWMEFIDKDLHKAYKHTGGRAVHKHQNKGE